MTPAFTRTVSFYKGVLSARIIIKFFDGRLSIVGDSRERGREHYCGQIVDLIRDEFGHNPAILLLCHYWKRWHLNDMRAGLPIQMDYLRAFPVEAKGDWYGNACKALKAAGLYEVDGYKFGHEWKREEVPDHVLIWIRDTVFAESI